MLRNRAADTNRFVRLCTLLCLFIQQYDDDDDMKEGTNKGASGWRDAEGVKKVSACAEELFSEKRERGYQSNSNRLARCASYAENGGET